MVEAMSKLPVPAKKSDWAAAAEQRILDAALPLASEAGWGESLIQRAAKAAGLSEPDAQLLMPNGGRDLAALLSRRHDRAALDSLGDPAALKVRMRIRQAVLARVEAAAADEAAVRRATAHLALPLNLPTGFSLLWESADALWRWAGDTATDENHYTKRAILSLILIETLATRLDQGADEAARKLDGRIDQVMEFETWKANLPQPNLGEMAAALGKIRYR